MGAKQDMMKDIWTRYLTIGLGPHLRTGDVRYVRAINGIVAIVSAILFLQIPWLIWLLPESRYILALFILVPLSWAMIPLLNHLRRYTAARVYFSGSCIALVTLVALQLGRETNNHLFMMSVFLGAFIIYPPRQGRFIVVVSVLSGLALVTMEIWFVFNGALLNAPPEFFALARVLSGSTLFVMVLFMSIHHYRSVNRAEELLEAEYQVSENLLLNILPAAVAARLKRGEAVIADSISSATVMFADISGFTPLSSSMPPEDLVNILNQLFTAFDHIGTRHGLEKIKTIGDAYMIAGGVPDPHVDHCSAVAECALEIMDHMKTAPAGLSLRIGIDTGPVVAGIIGTSKFSYDLWGDTVNMASRMESHGIPGSIQVSKRAYELLRGRYRLESRGTIEIKGKGPQEVYVLTGR